MLNIANTINYDTMFMKGVKDVPVEAPKKGDGKEGQITEKKGKTKKKNKNFDDEYDQNKPSDDQILHNIMPDKK